MLRSQILAGWGAIFLMGAVILGSTTILQMQSEKSLGTTEIVSLRVLRPSIEATSFHSREGSAVVIWLSGDGLIWSNGSLP